MALERARQIERDLQSRFKTIVVLDVKQYRAHGLPSLANGVRWIAPRAWAGICAPLPRLSSDTTPATTPLAGTG